MSSINYYENIQKYLFLYAAMLEQSNSVGLTDKAVHAENLFAHIFNIVYKWNLENANEVNVVQDSFDLHDINERVYVQVTTNKNHRKKYNDTVASFLAQNKGQYSKLIVLFIRPKVSPTIKRKVTAGNVVIELLDVPDLLKKILYASKDPATLVAINAALQHTIHPVIIDFQGADPFGFKATSISIISERPKGFYIHRKELITSIFDFIQASNGLLVGGPGFGKSFILEELKRHCLELNISCYIIRINEMVDGDNNEISEELKYNGDWLTGLSTITTQQSDYKNVLIFDAFDTAKDERLKANILKQIRRAIGDLHHWHILVSVRTYDASKSTRLLDLFPNVDIRIAISCRYIEIPELSETELSTALQSLPGISAIESKIKPDLRKLLKTPYFLKIFEELVDNPNELYAENNIDSEARLLNIFWRKKIDAIEENENFLRRLTQLLSQNEKLVCDKDEILNDANGSVFRGLISQGIIEEASVLRQRITFTHNILLDYAISRYLLKEDAQQQIIYISSNEKHPFIFRQSFVYFYHELWQADRDLFWAHYQTISNIEKPLFRLFHQTILNFVLVLVYQATEDLKPLLAGGDENKTSQQIRKTLEAIRFISGNEVRIKDIFLIAELATKMHWNYLWELGIFVEKGIDFYYKNYNVKALKILSEASCSFLSYVMNERLTFFNRPFLDNNGGYRGIKNLCDTYQFNRTRSKTLLLAVMEILDEEDFPIAFFHTISEKILTIFKNDRSLAIRLYGKLYARIENSDKPTQFGSAVMGMSSNRRQDYNVVHHRLEQNYSSMIDFDYESAMPLGLEILNLIGKDKYSYQDKISFPIEIGDVKTVISTGSYYYDENDQHGPFVHLKAIFEHLEKLAQPGSPPVNLKAAVLATLPHLKAGKLWGRMLHFLKIHSNQLYLISSQLLSKTGIYQSEDSIYEAGELITTIWPKLAFGKRRAIESAIHKIDTPISYYSRDSIENMKIRMLCCIPYDDLQLLDSKLLIETHPHVANDPKPYNGPTIAEARFHTKEERILHAGFDLSKPVDAALYPFYEKVESFNENCRKNEPTTITIGGFHELLPAVQLMFDVSKKDQYWNNQLKYSCDMEVSKFINNISGMNNLEISDKEFIRNTALHYLQSEVYITGFFHKDNSNERKWIDLYPNARIKSVLPLYNMMLTDPTLETYFLKLMNDPSEHVRSKAIGLFSYFWQHKRDIFWQIIKERISKETDFLCLDRILRIIQFDNILKSNLEEIRSICVIIIAKLKEVSKENRRDLWQKFTIIILKLILRHDAEFAVALIVQNTDCKEFCNDLIFEITSIIDPHDPKNEELDAKVANDRLFETLIRITEGQFKSIKQKGLSSDGVSDEFEIIDRVIQHLFFVLSSGRGDNRKTKITGKEEREFFGKIRPIVDHIISESADIDAGFMVAHTGYYFMQLMNHLLDLDPEYILKTSATIIAYSSKNNFTYDGSTLKEIVELTERIMADHKTLLSDKPSFESLLLILDLFINSGWQEALELTWRLKDAF